MKWILLLLVTALLSISCELGSPAQESSLRQASVISGWDSHDVDDMKLFESIRLQVADMAFLGEKRFSLVFVAKNQGVYA